MVKRYRSAAKKPRKGYMFNAAGQEVCEPSERTSVMCPACGEQGLRRLLGDNASSRYVNAWICSDCGTREALQGFFWQERAMQNKYLTKPR